ncbi:MAG: hypothetical protein ABIA63_13705 [bacterium]
MRISKEAISIIEKLAFRIHEVEQRLNSMIADQYEQEEIKNVINALKSRIGRFFMKNMDRRMIMRADSSSIKDYTEYFGLGDKKTEDEYNCKFCNSSTTSVHQNPEDEYFTLYCTKCSKETRIPKIKSNESI